MTKRKKQLSIRGLQNAAGFLQSKIANRLDTRYTPRLRFEIDRGQENAQAIGDILARIQAEKEDQSESKPQLVNTDTDSTEIDTFPEGVHVPTIKNSSDNPSKNPSES